jgi:putative MATE family efflux protein
VTLLPAPERRARILGLALPIVGGMISQNILNLVDTWFVGHLGDQALAAVGIGSFANFMAIAFITGLSTGVQAMASRRLGEGRETETAVPLNGGLLLALVIGLPWMLLLLWGAPVIFSVLVDDAGVSELGTGYFQARLLAVIAVGSNFAFRGYWNGVNLSRLYMRTLLVMHACNISLNWALIFGNAGFPELGTTGAGLGTAISTWIGTVYYIAQAWGRARGNGFLSAIPSAETLRTMLRVALPAGIQQFLFATGMTIFFWIVGQVGTRELAASNVLLNLMLVAVLPGLGFGLAAASLVGQSLGAGNPDDARRWGWDVARMAAITVGLLAIPGILRPDLLLTPFLKSPETLALAREPLRIIAIALPIDAIGMVLMNGLMGAGDSRRSMVVSVTVQWAIGLPLIYLVGVPLGLGLTAVWMVNQGYRLLQSGVYVALWRGGRWARIDV